ncbi:DNA-3-methyladenine glycosylase family protein [Methylocella silvestris]|uniref:DNA-3-methyladenine glycosylase family protein n=1 Tax=Methylocella silvestris TaxID=199596 RepID=UPI00017241EA|nr:hypothetical protein [Methylocella silvestris]
MPNRGHRPSAKDEELKLAAFQTAEAITSGALPLGELGALPADVAHAALTAVKGIGPWTADIYLMFCLRHSDAFALGDLALQEAARLAYGMASRPSVTELVTLAECAHGAPSPPRCSGRITRSRRAPACRIASGS